MAERKKASTLEIGETSTSPAKGSSSFQDAPVRAGCFGAKLGDEDRDLTMAEKNCFLTNSDEDVEELIGDASLSVEEFLCGDVGVEEDGGDKRHSVSPNVTIGGDVDVDDRRFSPDVEINRILR